MMLLFGAVPGYRQRDVNDGKSGEDKRLDDGEETEMNGLKLINGRYN